MAAPNATEIFNTWLAVTSTAIAGVVFDKRTFAPKAEVAPGTFEFVWHPMETGALEVDVAPEMVQENWATRLPAVPAVAVPA